MRFFKIVQFKTASKQSSRASSRVSLFKSKAIAGSSPGSAARKAITFVCRQNKTAAACSSIALQLKEVKVSMKNGTKTLVDVNNKLYNYSGNWDSKERTIVIKSKSIKFRGAPSVQSCRTMTGKSRTRLCKMLTK